MNFIGIVREYAVEQMVPELGQAYYTFTESDLRAFANRIRSSALYEASWIVKTHASDWEESIRCIDKEAESNEHNRTD